MKVTKIEIIPIHPQMGLIGLNYGHELALLPHYEISLEKILFRSLGELRALQATRKIEQAIEIDGIGFVP
jgi:hypothetical protein